jgi:hypothetical protein
MAVGVQKAWSLTATDNGTADTNIGYAEGQSPGSLNNAARAAMAATKGFANQITGAKTTGGSANAQTYTSDSVAAISGAYAAGMAFVFKAGYTNSGACTLNVDGVGAKSIKKGGAQAALAANDIVANGVYFVAYEASGDCFILLNPESGIVALDPLLAAIAALTTADDRMLDFTGSDTVAVVTYATVLSNIGAQASLGYTAANDSLVVKLAGSQTITGQKTMSGVDFVLDTAVGPTATGSAGFRGAPTTDKNSDYTFVLADAGMSFRHNEVSARTWTIPANASVAYPVGTTIVLINGVGSGNITLAITSDTLRRGDGTSGSGSRTIAANSICTIIKTASTEWYISGVFT